MVSTYVLAFALLNDVQACLVNASDAGPAIVLSRKGCVRKIPMPSSYPVFLKWANHGGLLFASENFHTLQLHTAQGKAGKEFDFPEDALDDSFDIDLRTNSKSYISGNRAILAGAKKESWPIPRFDSRRMDGTTAISPSGTSLLISVSNGKPRQEGGDPCFTLMRVDAGSQHLIALGPGASPKWSMDGRRCLAVNGTASGGYQLLLFGEGTAKPRVLKQTSELSIKAACFLSNGNILFMGPRTPDETKLTLVEMTTNGEFVAVWPYKVTSVLSDKVLLDGRPSSQD